MLTVQFEPRRDPLLGVVLENRYRLVEVLGRGGMGTVYLAEEIRLGRRYALKVLRPDLAQDRACVERFLREARMIARLEHPNIVDIHSFGEDPSGAVFFTMELLSGEDLETRIRARDARPYSMSQACDWAIQIARAVAAVHAEGVIHRDLKPQNVFLARRRDGTEIVKLLDFGIARPQEGSELTASHLTLGTPSYMSPEQFNRHPLDIRSDIYSFGVLLFKLLTGSLPFLGDAYQVVLQHVNSPVPIPSTIAPAVGITPELDAIVLTAMAKQPDERQATIAEVEAALIAAQARLSAAPVVPPAQGPIRTAALGSPPAPSPARDLAPAVAQFERQATEVAVATPQVDPGVEFTSTLLHPKAHGFAAAGQGDRSGVLEATEKVEPPATPAPAREGEAKPPEITATEISSGSHTDPVIAPVALSPGGSITAEKPQRRMLALNVAVAGCLLLFGWFVFVRGQPSPSLVETPANDTPGEEPSKVRDSGGAAPKQGPLPRVDSLEPVKPGGDEETRPTESETKTEPVKPEPVKKEPASKEAPKPETVKKEPVREDAPKPEPVKKEPPKPGPTKADASASPESQIATRAATCRKTHNAVGGPSITVEYTIGSTGKVLRAVPSENTPLGQCLAAAVKQQQFPPEIKANQKLKL